MKGFDEPNLQSAVGLKGSAAFYDTQSALELIEKETNAGKLPVISLRGFLIGLAPIPVNYHIYVAASEDGQPILIDPADGQVVATTKEDLAKVLEYNSHHNPERSTIHILVLERE
jgi:hypothetical protein